jgi:hypothetical protein
MAVIKDWLDLRLIVLNFYSHQNLLPSGILNKQGSDFLSFVLPKTHNFAAFQLASEICRSSHDKFIGTGRYHLFRLPQKWEEEIYTLLKKSDMNFTEHSISSLKSELLRMSGNIAITPVKGPVLLGSNSELADDSLFNAFARHYLESFSQDYVTYPYIN